MTNSYSLNVNLSFIGNVRINYYGISNEIAQLYLKENEFERQKNIKHLGVIADVMESSNHSRFEYLMLQCFLTDVIENTYKGTPNAIGSIKIDGKEYFGNSLLKTWFLISNFGHCYKTIGDEKSLLLFTNERKGFKSELLNNIEDNELKIYAENVINQFDYPNFHHLLAIWRINKIIRNKNKKKQILKIYKLYLLKETKVKVNRAKLDLLKHLAKYSRELAVISIDGHNTHIPFTINPLSTLMSVDIYESKLKNQSVFNVLEPLVSILVKEIYLNKEVLTKQREYEVNSLNAIRKYPKNRKGYNDIIKNAFEKGLIQSKEIKLEHFHRFNLKIDFIQRDQIFNEYRNIQTVKRNCSDVESSLDTNFISKEKILDFYVNSNFTNKQFPVFIYNICRLLENEFEKTVEKEIRKHSEFIGHLNLELTEKIPSEQDRQEVIRNSLKYFFKYVNEKVDTNLPGFQNLITSILDYFIDERYTYEISDGTSSYDHIGVNFENIEIGHLLRNLRKAIKYEKDLDRIHEINHIQNGLKKKFKGFILCSISRINIYDFSQSPNRRLITDIDSLIVKIDKNEFIIEFNETKNTKKQAVSNAKKDLKNNLVPILNKNAKGYRILPVKDFGAKLRIKLNAT